MNELIDKLAIQCLFLLIIFIIGFIFNYTYSFFYTEQRLLTLKNFYPSKNSPHSIHFFSRFFSLLFILGSININIGSSLLFSLLYFAFIAILLFGLFLASLYILDSITLYNFEFDVEILSKKNYSYALISASNSIAVAFLLKNISLISFDSIINLIFIWLFSIMLIGFSIKLFPYVFNQSLNRHVVQKNLSISLTYMGFILGNSLAITSCFPKIQLSLEWYSIHIITSALLLIMVISFIFFAMKKTLRIKQDYKGDLIEETDVEPEVGNGVYNGISYFTACYVAIIVINHIQFGSFYPVINSIQQ